MPHMDWKVNDCATPKFAVGAGTRVTRRCSRARHLCLRKLFEQSSANMIHPSQPTRAGGLIPQSPNRESESRLIKTTTNNMHSGSDAAGPQTLNRQVRMIRSHDRSTTNERKLKHTTALQPGERPSFEARYSASDAYTQNNCSTHVGLIKHRLPQSGLYPSDLSSAGLLLPTLPPSRLPRTTCARPLPLGGFGPLAVVSAGRSRSLWCRTCPPETGLNQSTLLLCLLAVGVANDLSLQSCCLFRRSRG